MCEVIHVPHQQSYDVYVSSFRDETRRAKMIQRCIDCGLEATIYNFTENDPKIHEVAACVGDPNASGRFLVVFNWLRLCHDFYHNSTNDYCVMMEDDIYLKKSIKVDIMNAIEVMKNMNYPIMLLGYLMTYTPDQAGFLKFTEDDQGFSFYHYPDDLWGSHCFIINKPQAKYFLDKYTIEYIATLYGTGGDWIFTKDALNGNRALMFPPLAVEMGLVRTTHQGQIDFHRNCSDFQYNQHIYTA